MLVPVKLDVHLVWLFWWPHSQTCFCSQKFLVCTNACKNATCLKWDLLSAGLPEQEKTTKSVMTTKALTLQTALCTDAFVSSYKNSHCPQKWCQVSKHNGPWLEGGASHSQHCAWTDSCNRVCCSASSCQHVNNKWLWMSCDLCQKPQAHKNHAQGDYSLKNYLEEGSKMFLWKVHILGSNHLSSHTCLVTQAWAIDAFKPLTE